MEETGVLLLFLTEKKSKIMDYTSKMVALMKSMRRERNGAVADAMCTSASGLNYGVSLPTVRQIARAEQKDYEFAAMLWHQDVRELRLAALHIAQPELLTEDRYDFWGDGIRDEELAEEAAFALLRFVPDFEKLFKKWIVSEKPLLRYAVLQAAARCPKTESRWGDDALKALEALEGDFSHHEKHLIAQGIVAMLAALALRGEEDKAQVKALVGKLGATEEERYVSEEMEWRLEF